MNKALEQARELVKMLEEMGAKENEVLLSSLHPGDTFKIGKHDFIVLEQSNGQTKVISKGLMAEEKTLMKIQTITENLVLRILSKVKFNQLSKKKLVQKT